MIDWLLFWNDQNWQVWKRLVGFQMVKYQILVNLFGILRTTESVQFRTNSERKKVSERTPESEFFGILSGFSESEKVRISSGLQELELWAQL